MSNFPCLLDGKIPGERVNVFISSAMNSEDETNWFDIRKRVCNKLKICPYINPFTIEEHGSEIPSSQYFLYKVQQCDILILLLKEKIRPGVRQEIELARNSRKAIIPYFYNPVDSNSDASILKAEIIASDYCTFKLFNNFDNLEEIISYDLLHNIIDKYKYQHFLDSQKQIDSFTDFETIKYHEVDNPIKKTTLQLFKSCYGIIADEIGFSYRNPQQKNEQEESEFHSFGCRILKWVLFGIDFVSLEEINSFTNKIKTFYNGAEWIVRRWDAIRYYISDEVCIALQHEEKALQSARNDKAPEWLVGNILIDCRNLDSESKDGFHFSEKYQHELDNRDELIYIPILDRYTSESFAELLDEDIKLGTSLPGTQHFGGNITNALEKAENYIFMSLIYGSFTHLYFARSNLSKIIYKYSKIYNNTSLMFSAIKLIILSGNTKLLNNIVLKEWDRLYYFLSANADDLWLITDNVNKRDKLHMKLLIIQLLGVYINDKNFSCVNDYLFEISQIVTWNESSEYLKSIYSNMSRIPPFSIIGMLINILGRRQIHMGSEISKVLLSLDIQNIPLEILSTLEKNLEENLQMVLERNGTPQCVAHLVNQCPGIFSKLESYLPENMNPIEKSLYDINVGRSQNWSKVILNSINDAFNQLKTNTESNVVHGFATNPYKTIQMVIDNCTDDGVINILKENFLPLAAEVLNSKAHRELKEDCMDCLIDVIIILNQKSVEIDKDLLNTIKSLQIEKEKNIDFFTDSTSVTTMYRWIMLKTVSGLDVKSDILSNYLSFSQQQDNERYVLARCINQYILFCIKNMKQIEELFLLMIIEMCDDTYFLVRKEASFSLVSLLSTQYSDIARQKLIGLTTDSSPNVRGGILSIIADNKDIDIEFRKEILECYLQDANYGIRKRAEKIKE